MKMTRTAFNAKPENVRPGKWQLVRHFPWSCVYILKWGSQNYSHLCQVLSWCNLPEIIKIGQSFTKLFQK